MTRAQLGMRAHVDGQEEPGVAQMFVQLLAGHASLDRGIHILGRHRQDRGHVGQIDAEATLHRLCRRAMSEGDNRKTMIVADCQSVRHILRRLRKQHRKGGRGGVPAVPGAMLIAQSSTG